MRGAFVFGVGLVAIGIGACAAFGADTPAAPSTLPDGAAPVGEGGTMAGGDGGVGPGPEGGAARGCQALPVPPKTCIDFETKQPGLESVTQHAAVATAGDASNHWMLASVSDDFAGNNAQLAYAYYPAPIPNSPATVHWSFDILLDPSDALSGLGLPQLANNADCVLQPRITPTELSVVEACGNTVAAPSVTAKIALDGKWWNFDFAVTFVSLEATLTVIDGDGHSTTSSGLYPGLFDNTNLVLEFGLTYADGNSVGSKLALDNLIVDY